MCYWGQCCWSMGTEQCWSLGYAAIGLCRGCLVQREGTWAISTSCSATVAWSPPSELRLLGLPKSADCKKWERFQLHGSSVVFCLQNARISVFDGSHPDLFLWNLRRICVRRTKMVSKAVSKRDSLWEIVIAYLGKRSCTLIAKSLHASLASRVRLL